MAVEFRSFSTEGLDFVSADQAADPSVWGTIDEYFQEWLGEICNPTIDASSLVTGSGYGSDATYTNVDLKRAALTQSGGRGMKATVTVTGGGISAVEITKKGNGFKAGDQLIISDLTQLAGLGGGFRITVDSGDASIGLIADLDTALDITGNYIGWMVGVNRETSYTYGCEIMKHTQSTSTTYNRPFYQYTPSSNGSYNGYYSGFSQQFNSSIATTWNGDTTIREVYVTWCNDSGNRFFIVNDSSYSQLWGFYEAVRDVGKDYVPVTVASEWVHIFGGNYVYKSHMGPYIYNTAYTGWQQNYAHPSPSDGGVFFENVDTYGRAWAAGKTPPAMKFHAINSDMGWGHIYQDGTDTYRRINNGLYIQTS